MSETQQSEESILFGQKIQKAMKGLLEYNKAKMQGDKEAMADLHVQTLAMALSAADMVCAISVHGGLDIDHAKGMVEVLMEDMKSRVDLFFPLYEADFAKIVSGSEVSSIEDVANDA